MCIDSTEMPGASWREDGGYMGLHSVAAPAYVNPDSLWLSPDWESWAGQPAAPRTMRADCALPLRQHGWIGWHAGSMADAAQEAVEATARDDAAAPDDGGEWLLGRSYPFFLCEYRPSPPPTSPGTLPGRAGPSGWGGTVGPTSLPGWPASDQSWPAY